MAPLPRPNRKQISPHPLLPQPTSTCSHDSSETASAAQVGNEQYPSTAACCDAAIVTVRWLGFHRIWQGSGKVFDSIDLFLPDVQFGTQVCPLSSLRLTPPASPVCLLCLHMVSVCCVCLFCLPVEKVQSFSTDFFLWQPGIQAY